MARDYYAEAHVLVATLQEAGLGSWAERINTAREAGSTGTEILMALRCTLVELQAAVGLDHPDVAASAARLVDGISDALR
jgi:hypothetical protein